MSEEKEELKEVAIANTATSLGKSAFAGSRGIQS